MDLKEYIEEQLRNNKKVIIEVDKEVINGYMNMNWLIDGRFKLNDMPFEVFE